MSMFFSEEYISETEKINRIYSMLRAQRRARYFGLFIKLSLLGSIIYSVYFLSLPENIDTKNQISELIEAKMSEIIVPLVGNMVQEITENAWQSLSWEVITSTGARINRKNTPALPSGVNITPEMIKAVQDSMGKK